MVLAKPTKEKHTQKINQPNDSNKISYKTPETQNSKNRKMELYQTQILCTGEGTLE